jgi:PAS domain S-box-containing protein
MIAESKSSQPRSARTAQSADIEDGIRHRSNQVVHAMSNNPYSRVSSLSPGRIALGYAVIAILWIAFSDAIVTHFKLHPFVMTIKGIVFVFVTASLLYFTTRLLVQAVRVTAQELGESEAYLAEAQRLSHTGSWAFDLASNKYVYISEECFRMFEFDPQEGLPTREAISRLIDPEDWDGVQASFDKTLREKADTSSEFRIVLPSGTVKHIQVIRHPVLNEAGAVVTIVGTAMDITERKRAEEEVRNTASQWQATFDAVKDSVLLLDKDFHILRANHAAAEFLGLPFDRIVGGHCYDLTHRTSTPPAECPLAKMRQSRWHEEAEVLARPEGPWLSVSVDPIFDLSGELTQVVHVARDITERKRAEEALRESETRFRTFVDHAGDALFVLDIAQGTIVDANRSACESLGYTREELIGSTPLNFHLNGHQAELESIAQRATAGETVFDSHLHRRKDGSTFPVEVHTSLVSYGSGRFLLMVARDISDRVQAEEQRDQLRQLEAELAHLDRLTMLGELTASIAHEVNQPLAGVVSNASASLRWLAGDSPNLEEAREAARRIVRDGKRAGEVITRIRALTKKTSTPREKLDLNETLRQVLALVGDEAKRKSVMIRTQFADDLSPVSGDQVQLQQVVLNLAMNAIEAMSSIGERPRELVIGTRNLECDQVQVTVEDSGVGLEPNTMQKIFEPFYTTKPTGMGMGLSISRSILQAHGGRLWATAKDGPGTIFYFTLPKYQKDESNAKVAGAA